MTIDPAKINDLTNEQLVEANEYIKYKLEELQAEQGAVRDLLFARLGKLSGTVVDTKTGKYALSKAKRFSFGITVAQAREYGAIKEVVDNAILKGLYLKGAKIPETVVSEYLIIRRINEEADDQS